MPPAYLNDIRHLLALTGIHRVVVIGTSLGGMLAAAMTAAMPAVLAGVVLNDVGPEIGTAAMVQIMAYLSDDRPEPDWPSVVHRLKTAFPTLCVGTEEDWMRLAKATFRECDDGMLRNDWDNAIIRPLLRSKMPDLWPMFKGLARVPTVLIRGETSEILNPIIFDRMAERIGGLRRVTVPKVGHVPNLMEPESLDAIDSLLAAAGHA